MLPWVSVAVLFMLCGCGSNQQEYVAGLENSVKPLIQKDLSGTIKYFGLSDQVAKVSEVKLHRASKSRNYYTGVAKINFKPLEIDGKKVETKVKIDNLGIRTVPAVYEYLIDLQVMTEKPNDDMFNYKYDSEQLSSAIGEYLDLVMQVARATAEPK